MKKGNPVNLKKGLLVRGDSVNCPLAFSLDSYSNCEPDCINCHFRRLNKIWDMSLRPLDFENFERTLKNGVTNKNPRSPLAWALAQKKTIRFGNKADPFQELAEHKYRVSKRVLEVLRDYRWPVVIETKFTHVLMEYEATLAIMKPHLHIFPIISPGFEQDWEIFERQKTTPPEARLTQLEKWKDAGFRVGVNGEPFIPGYHTVEQFEETLKLLKSHKIPSYNTYNLHLNEFVAKRLADLGLDIRKIWNANKDDQWRPVLQQLIELARKYDIVLGSPDFINSGAYFDKNNTCCGLEVDNPCTFNTHTWKRLLISGEDPNAILDKTWDGVGEFELGRKVMFGPSDKFYTIRDIDWGKTAPPFAPTDGKPLTDGLE
jgi:DNA repair photolyase